MAQPVKNPPAMQETLVQIPGSGRYIGEGNGNPLQYSCLENPRDGGAWWAAVYGVSQSQTRLKGLSSSSSSSCGGGEMLRQEGLAWANESNVLELMDLTNSTLHLRSRKV